MSNYILTSPYAFMAHTQGQFYIYLYVLWCSQYGRHF